MSDHAHHVEPGGEPDRTTRDGVGVVKFSVGGMDNNAYLLDDGTATVLIDAADDPDRLLEIVGAAGPDLVITTHRHGDHWQGLAQVVALRSPALVAGRPDQAQIADGAGVDGIRPVWDGDVVQFGRHRLEVIGLVGHTPGSIALVLDGDGPDPAMIFTGDALFPGGPGKTPDPAAFASLMDDLQAKVFDRFGDDTIVHPGHGDSTTLGRERPQLSRWRERGW